jgi:uncharacterized protein (DUF1501 family)
VEARPDDRILVVIQLDGGNDGLNTVIPYADENYARLRRELRIKDSDIIKLDDAIGLHPAMKPAADLLDDGRLSIIQGVGYPNPNRSHFESMAIWHHARIPTEEHDGNGWLGRAAECLPGRRGAMGDSIYVGAEAVPVALRGRRANAVSLQTEDDLRLAESVASPQSSAPGLDVSEFVERTIAQSFDAARQFGKSNGSASAAEYPSTKLAGKLRLISKLLKLDGGTRIFYASQSGYDTHSAQLYTHYDLLRELAGALKAFLNDLKAARLDDRVIILAFSEFGRRAAENGSAGTDHGAAAPVLLAGPAMGQRIIGTHPSLIDLDQGDLKMSLDFRCVYATLLEKWLRMEPATVLSGNFASLTMLDIEDRS